MNLVLMVLLELVVVDRNLLNLFLYLLHFSLPPTLKVMIRLMKLKQVKSNYLNPRTSKFHLTLCLDSI